MAIYLKTYMMVSISQETRHRAKILSHTLQCSLRKKEEEDAFVEVRKKSDSALVVIHGLQKRNDEATRKLLLNGAVLKDVPIE